MAKGKSAKNPPVIEKIGRPHTHRRAKRAGKFLGFLRDFSGKI